MPSRTPPRQTPSILLLSLALVLVLILNQTTTTNASPVPATPPRGASGLKAASQPSGYEFMPINIGKPGQCSYTPPPPPGQKSRKTPSRGRAPSRMDWARCRSELGVGWKYKRRCYGMEGALALTQPSPEGVCYFPEDGWVLPSLHSTFAMNNNNAKPPSSGGKGNTPKPKGK